MTNNAAADAPKVLLVEDEPGIALLEREVLERCGFRVEDAGHGQRALECLAACDQIALVVLDYRLPDMTGADVVAALGERIASLPVLVVTGYPDPEVEKRMRGAGVADYIVKDLDLKFLEDLPQAAHAAMGSRSIQARRRLTARSPTIR